jgi:hypothetical protein
MNAEGVVVSLVEALDIFLTVNTALWANEPLRQAVGCFEKFMKEKQSRVTGTSTRASESASLINSSLAVGELVNGTHRLMGTILYILGNAPARRHSSARCLIPSQRFVTQTFWKHCEKGSRSSKLC